MWEWLKIIGNIILLLLGFKKRKADREDRIKKEAEKNVKEGIRKKDPSRITSGFDKLNRL